MLDQTQVPILAALESRGFREHTPFYTPGHKRGRGTPAPLLQALKAGCLKLDLPELPGLDNLFMPEGIIQEAQILAAATFSAEQTWFLVNGSTCGMIAALMAVCQPGDYIILPRNVHQSAIAGLILTGAIPVFVAPAYNAELDLVGSPTPESVALALTQYPQAKAVLITSPTYEGVCAELETIAPLVHQYGIPLLVDEAHGPHFHFHPDLPVDALTAGADLTVQSTHKVLAALTQASMLHVQGTRIDRQRLQQALSLVQSSSPNYLLLAALDAARQQMALQGEVILTETLHLATQAREQIKSIPLLQVLGTENLSQPGFAAIDPTRLRIRVAPLGRSGFEVDEQLDHYGVTAEFPSLSALTFIISLGNTAADIDRLVNGLSQIAEDSLPQSKDRPLIGFPLADPITTPALAPRQAFFASHETVPFDRAVDRICAELICPYPPGIPILLPGEVMTATAGDYLRQVYRWGGTISGCSDPTLQSLKVVCKAEEKLN